MTLREVLEDFALDNYNFKKALTAIKAMGVVGYECKGLKGGRYILKRDCDLGCRAIHKCRPVLILDLEKIEEAKK